MSNGSNPDMVKSGPGCLENVLDGYRVGRESVRAQFNAPMVCTLVNRRVESVCLNWSCVTKKRIGALSDVDVS
jgi:hypothetical protein